jgi:hypothetical protein
MGDLYSLEIAEILIRRRYQNTDSEQGLLARSGRSDGNVSGTGTNSKTCT